MGAAKLKEGGHLITYVSTNSIPDVLNLMCPHLRYWWLLGVRHSGARTNFYAKKVHVNWKALLWFVQGKSKADGFVVDFIDHDPADKTYDAWQQGLATPLYFIEKLTARGDLVVDPMCGSGTTLVAAKTLSRKGWGCDLDSERVAIARGRVKKPSKQR